MPFWKLRETVLKGIQTNGIQYDKYFISEVLNDLRSFFEGGFHCRESKKGDWNKVSFLWWAVSLHHATMHMEILHCYGRMGRGIVMQKEPAVILE